MKIDKLLILFLIIGCILVAGYFTRSISATGTAKPASDAAYETNVTAVNLTNTSGTSPLPASPGTGTGQISIGIGAYDALLPVLIDNIPAGNVSKGKPLALNLVEGTHMVKICQGTVCISLPVEITPPIKTTINFEERLRTDAPSGSLNISVGNYPVSLPVFIDTVRMGNVSLGNPVNQTMTAGNHTVRYCLNTTCFDESVDIPPASQVLFDLGARLQKNVPQGPLTVSIGGFDADLPVLIDSTNAGNVSKGHPLEIRLNVGNHTVVVCAGKICEQEVVAIVFAKPAVADFGERLENDVEFTEPTARITMYSMSSRVMTVDVEFINPDSVDHTISATVSDVYTFTNSQNVRESDSEQQDVSSIVKAGARVTKQVIINLGSESNVIANAPVISDIITE